MIPWACRNVRRLIPGRKCRVGFVHDAEKGFGKMVCVIPRGQARVARSNATAKWVCGDI